MISEVYLTGANRAKGGFYHSYRMFLCFLCLLLLNVFNAELLLFLQSLSSFVIEIALIQ